MNIRWHVLLFSVLIFVMAFTAAFGGKPIQAQAGKIKVVTTITILADVARNVTGDKAEVISLVPPAGDVHEFEPKPADLKTILEAKVILINGLRLEPFIEKLIKDSRTTARVVTVSNGVIIRPFGEAAEKVTPQPGLPKGALGVGGQYACSEPPKGEELGDCDPHVWQDPNNVVQFVSNIQKALSEVDPANAATYKTNAESYTAKLIELDKEIQAGVAQIPENRRVLVTNHDALGYFVARYGFKVVGVVLPGGGTTQEPTPQEVAKLIDQIKAAQIPAMFTENTANRKLIDQIASGAGVKVVQSLYTDALDAEGTPAGTYLGMMRANLKILIEALK